MTNSYVVIDVEATGNLNLAHSRMIEVALVVIENGEPVDEFATLLNPETRIPPFISSLTKISNNDVKDAPLFSDVAHKLKNLIANRMIVGHNVLFDIRFLNKQFSLLNMDELRNEYIDTVELTQILYPTLKQYKLSSLAKSFNFKHSDPHRALSDTLVTAELFLHLKEKLHSLPHEVIRHLTKLQRGFHSNLHSLLKEAMTSELKGNRYFTYKSLALYNIFQTDEKEELKTDISFGHLVDEFYRADGLYASHLPSYEKREAQQDISELIYDLFQEEKHGLIEAKTGTGKTIAYLLPALYEAVKNNEQLVISTDTLNLQTQIVTEDLKTLEESLKWPFSYAILKGKRHYLNINEFVRQLGEHHDSYNINLMKAMIVVWLTETKTGHLSELSLRENTVSFLNDICAQTEKGHEELSYYRHAFEKAEESHLIIVNHALLLADLHLENKLIPAYDKVIIDEGHKLADVARAQFSLIIDLGYTFKMLDKFSYQRESLFEELIYELNNFEQFINQLIEQENSAETHILLRELEDEFVQSILLEMIQRIVNKINHIEGRFAEDSLEARTLALLKEKFSHFHKMYVKKQAIVSVRRDRGLYLNIQEENSSQIIREKLFDGKKSVILTSATLVANQSFTYIEAELGLSELDITKQLYKSPFDLKKQAKIMLPSDFPAVNDDDFKYVATEAIYSLVTMLEGRTLILFTSHKLLKSVYYLLDEVIGLQYNLIAQDITHTNKHDLVEAFKGTKDSVLLGTNALWEGIDIPGDLLQCLIIMKLPFENINDPTYKMKKYQLEKQDINSFYYDTLPRMILQLKQGIGRLIRRADDKGVIFILDNRFSDASYHTHIWSSLKEYRIINARTKELIEKTGRFLL